MNDLEKKVKELVERQSTVDSEIKRVCQGLCDVWMGSKTPKKYSVPAHEAHILLLALQKERVASKKEAMAKEEVIELLQGLQREVGSVQDFVTGHVTIRVDGNPGTAYECPVCGNEEIELGQNYCQICGEPIEWIED